MIQIGQKVILDGEVLHVQDVDRINLLAKAGIPDRNQVVWDAEWIETERIKRLHQDLNYRRHPGEIVPATKYFRLECPVMGAPFIRDRRFALF